MKRIHQLIIASSVEPSQFQFSDSLRSFLNTNKLDLLSPHIVQVTQAVTCRNELLRLHARLKQIKSAEAKPLTIVFTSPAAIDLLSSHPNDPVCVETMEAIKNLADRAELAGVGPTTTARIQSQWGASSGIKIHPSAATEGLQACLNMIGAIGLSGLDKKTMAKRSVLVVGAAAGTSQRVTSEVLTSECFYAIYENVTVPDLASRLRKSVTGPATERRYCACVCQSGAAARAVIQSFVQESQSGENIANHLDQGQNGDQTKFVLFPRGASAILALKRSRLPVALLSCEDISGSAQTPHDSDPTENT